MLEFFTDYLDAFKNWKNIDGKAKRKCYWMTIVVAIMVALFLFLVTLAFSTLTFINYIYALLLIVPFFSLTVRRLHDTGRSGTALLWLLVPIVGWIYVLYLLLQKEK